MNAGRELDAQVAEKVFALPIFTREEMVAEAKAWWPQQPDCRSFMRGFWAYPDTGEGVRVEQDFQPYSTEIAAAWRVVEQVDLFNNGTRLAHEGGEWILTDWTNEVLAKADTAPLAICLAALKALGVTVE